MRSSGWSSDVCSSDLRWAWPRDHSAVILTNERPERMPRDIAEAPLYDEELICVGAASLIEKLGSGSTFPDVEAAYSRSEEHTSELQSLMRISYAVFSLKKKKIPNAYQPFLYKI